MQLRARSARVDAAARLGVYLTQAVKRQGDVLGKGYVAGCGGT